MAALQSRSCCKNGSAAHGAGVLGGQDEVGAGLTGAAVVAGPKPDCGRGIQADCAQAIVVLRDCTGF